MRRGSSPALQRYRSRARWAGGGRDSSLSPSRRTRRCPSLSPSGPGAGDKSGGSSSIVKSCSTSVDGGRQPLTALSVLLVGVPLRTMPQPVSKRCLESSASTCATRRRRRPCCERRSPSTRSNPVVSQGAESGIRMPMPTRPRRRNRPSSAAVRRRQVVPAASRSMNGDRLRGIGAEREVVGNGRADDVRKRLPRKEPTMTKRSGRTAARAMRGSVDGTGVAATSAAAAGALASDRSQSTVSFRGRHSWRDTRRSAWRWPSTPPRRLVALRPPRGSRRASSPRSLARSSTVRRPAARRGQVARAGVRCRYRLARCARASSAAAGRMCSVNRVSRRTGNSRNGSRSGNRSTTCSGVCREPLVQSGRSPRRSGRAWRSARRPRLGAAPIEVWSRMRSACWRETRAAAALHASAVRFELLGDRRLAETPRPWRDRDRGVRRKGFR